MTSTLQKNREREGEGNSKQFTTNTKATTSFPRCPIYPISIDLTSIKGFSSRIKQNKHKKSFGIQNKSLPLASKLEECDRKVNFFLLSINACMCRF